MEIPFYQVTLPMPVSVNASHILTKGYRDKATGKWMKGRTRSPEYEEWLQYASIAFRQQYPYKPSEKFTGRLRLEAIFCFIDGAKGTLTSDVDNRLKALQDFLQDKFFLNDKQIDQIVAHRRHVTTGNAQVIVRIYEVPDRRYDDPDLIFNPKPKD